MEMLWTLIEGAVLFLSGLAARFTLLVLVVAVMLSLVLPVVYAGEGARRLLARLRVQRVNGLRWRPQAYYSPAHAWLRERAGRVRMGLDDLAAHLLGEPESITLPTVGRHLHEGEPLMTIVTGAQDLVVKMPVTGVVRRVNPRLVNHPETVSKDPYHRGWLVDIAPADHGYRRLPHGDEARAWFAGEASRLSAAIEHATGTAAADGGELIVPAFVVLGDARIRALVREFLRI